MTKQTKRRIRKTVQFARTMFLVLFGLFIMLTAFCNGESVAPAIIFFAVATICFGISYLCDYLLGGGNKSPFYH